MITCKNCNTGFEVTKEDRAFLDELAPTVGNQRLKIPDPQLCVDCRLQGRLMFRNERTLYHRKSDLTGKQIVSIFSSDKSYKVYDQEEWWSDKWDPLEYGRDFDFSRTFTEQFSELSLAVPHTSLYTNNVENSYYTNYALNFKNSYLVFGGANSEDCLFAKGIRECKDCVDCLTVNNCEKCYEGVASSNCYNCQFFAYSRNCSDCIFIEECQDVKNSILCFGIRNKEYCFMNEFVGKEKFEHIREELGTLTHEKIELLRKKFEGLKAKLPHIQSHLYASQNSTGDLIVNSNNCHNCFDAYDSEDCRNILFVPKAQKSMDCIFGAPTGVKFCYNTCSSMGSNMISTFLSWFNDNVFYSMEVANSKNCFGCIGLKQKEYCIFNKQYSKEEYEKLMPKIVEHMTSTGEWGEYLAPQVATMGYNETIAQEYFPLSKEQALAQGFQWWDKMETNLYKGPQTQVPNSIEEVDDDIVNKILDCEVSKKSYKIIPQELKFYRENGLPLPRICLDERHKARLLRRNPYKLFDRNCAKCGILIQTNYSPDRPETVYCEACYLKEIY